MWQESFKCNHNCGQNGQWLIRMVFSSCCVHAHTTWRLWLGQQHTQGSRATVGTKEHAKQCIVYSWKQVLYSIAHTQCHHNPASQWQNTCIVAGPGERWEKREYSSLKWNTLKKNTCIVRWHSPGPYAHRSSQHQYIDTTILIPRHFATLYWQYMACSMDFMWANPSAIVYSHSCLQQSEILPDSWKWHSSCMGIRIISLSLFSIAIRRRWCHGWYDHNIWQWCI